MKIKRRYAAGLALVALLIALGVGGRILWQRLNKEVTVSREGFSMNTVISISATGREEAARPALDESLALLNHLNDELSLYQEDSTLSKINALLPDLLECS